MWESSDEIEQTNCRGYRADEESALRPEYVRLFVGNNTVVPAASASGCTAVTRIPTEGMYGMQ